ncbi:hypothetical protein, partial [Treponema succinifaciens]|uniref:hypothetical protein n=1 Tax=Treponema succinifaciens TaxID=167 RepID=UPI003FF016E9
FFYIKFCFVIDKWHNISGDISGTGGKYSLENIYMATFSNYGFFGLALYVGFLILVFLKSIFYLLYKK